MSNYFKCLLIYLSFLSFTGCAVKQAIRYDVDDIKPGNISDLKNISIDIEPFVDNRKTVNENAVQFTDDHETNINGKKMCINSDKNYEQDSIGNQMAAAIMEHLTKRGTFKQVVVGSKAAGDFYLKGELRQYFGKQEFSVGSAVGSQFGLIGALSTAGLKTPGVIKIELTNLKLFGTGGNLVAKLDDISKIFEGDFQADAYCWAIYWNTNEKLKEVASVLIEDIEKKVLEIRRAAK